MIKSKLRLACLGCVVLLTACGDVSDGTESLGESRQELAGLPPNGKILMGMGQDTDTLTAYRNANPSVKPGFITLYTNLMSTPSSHLNGIPQAAGGTGLSNFGSGNVDFAASLAQYPGAALSVGLTFSSSDANCNDVPAQSLAASGDNTWKVNARKLVDYLKSLNRDVYLRIGYEFDAPSWNCYQPSTFKAAFQYIKGYINSSGASRVATVWQSATYPTSGGTNKDFCNDTGHLDTWYPGDAYVDYVGSSNFTGGNYLLHQWPSSCNTSQQCSPRSLQDRLVSFAAAHDKYLMVAEAAPQGYDLQTGGAQPTAACIFNRSGQTNMSSQAIWDEWYVDYFNWIETNSSRVRVAAYINTDWDSQSMWQCCAGGYWGDSTIQHNSTIMNNFMNRIGNTSYYVVPSYTLGNIGGSGSVSWQKWTGVGGTVVSAIPTGTTPSATGTYTSFEAASNAGDQYGLRVRGYLVPPSTGPYTFWVAGDDNSELWLSTDSNPANKSRIAYHTDYTGSREWNKYTTQKSSVRNLVAGVQYYVEALMKEGGGGDNLAVGWLKPLQSGSSPSEVIPGSALSPYSGSTSGTGLTAVYFDNMDFTTQRVARTDSAVDFNWGNGAPDASVGADTFSVRWTGQVQPLYSQTYTFHTYTDDGVRLWVNDTLIIDRWVNQGPTEWPGSIALTAGTKYNIKMEYYENGGGSVARLSWSSSSQAKQTIPQSQLYP